MSRTDTKKEPIKLWVDDIRPAPPGYARCRSVNEAKRFILSHEVALLDIDHDAGDYCSDGGDYIKLLDWLEAENIALTIHIHSMNPVGVMNMRRIIAKNNWKEV